MADVVRQELEELAYPIKAVGLKHVETKGKLNDVAILNMQLRTANRVMLMFSSFKAIDAEELYKNAKELSWEQWISPSGYFSIDSFVKNDSIKDNRYANLKLKDAIADHFVKEFGKRPNSGPDRKGSIVYLHWSKNQAQLFLDSSGDSLAKHGYKSFVTKAPMLENLASALIMQSQWNKKSHFINPMCGSGTLAIEAALIALDIYPGQYREDYAFKNLRMFPPRIADKTQEQIQKDIPKEIPFKIIASDIDEKAVQAAKKNAENAGVDHLINFEVCDFRDSTIPEGDGVVMINPEYGKRLGEVEELKNIYKEIGDFFKHKCKGKMGYIFTGNLELSKKVGLRTKSRTPFYNGSIECRLLEYEIF